MKFLVKLFNASNRSATVEAFAILADHLREDVFQLNSARIHVQLGRRLLFEDDGNSYILRKMKVLLEMFLQMGKLLPRYSFQHLVEAADKMLALLDLHMTIPSDNPPLENRTVLTPFMAFSCLDPQVRWWRCWMHGRLGRKAILKALEQHWLFAEFVFKVSSFDCNDAGNTRRSELEAASARRILVDLLLHEESRLVLGKHIDGFPDTFLDYLLEEAMEEGQNGKFAWKICYLFTTSKSRRQLFFKHHRLQKIGISFLAVERSYHVKTKLLRLITEYLLAVGSDAECSEAILLHCGVVSSGESMNFGQLIMTAIYAFVKSSCSRDPDAPLSLAHACLAACASLCRTHVGRRLVSQYDDFLMCAVQLVKEHSVEVCSLLPILTSVVSKDSESELLLRRFLSSNLVRDIWIQKGNGVLWHRPIEICDCAAQGLVSYLNDLKLLMTLQDPESVEAYKPQFDIIRHWLFLILCHPIGSELLVKDDSFVRSVIETFNVESFQEGSWTDILLDLLDFALCRADFLLNMRSKWRIDEMISTVLTKYFYLDSVSDIQDLEDPVASSSNLWIQSSMSTRLAAIYSKFSCLGGPNERRTLAPVAPLKELSENQFCPATFIAAPLTNRNFTTDKPDGVALIDFFIHCVGTEQPIQYSNFLVDTVKDLPHPILTQPRLVTFSGADREIPEFYQAVLTYGKNLNIISHNTGINDLEVFIKGVQDIAEEPGAKSAMDWFAAAVYLLFAGDSEAAIDFLQKFSQHGESTLHLWPLVSPDHNFAAAVVGQIMTVIEPVLETELPRVVAALTMHGITASNIVVYWLNQCFVNILDWPEICNYITLSVVGGRKYQAFFCCCIFCQIADEICQRAYDHCGNAALYSFLLGPMSFQLRDCISFLTYLSQKYSS